MDLELGYHSLPVRSHVVVDAMKPEKSEEDVMLWKDEGMGFTAILLLGWSVRFVVSVIFSMFVWTMQLMALAIICTLVWMSDTGKEIMGFARSGHEKEG